MDVCHNIDGFRAVLAQIKVVYPEVKDLKLIFGISKSKKLDDIVCLIEKDELVKDIYLVSRPHMRLYKVEDAHKYVQSLGSQKLRDVIFDETVTNDDTQSDTTSTDAVHINNISKTLDTVVKFASTCPDSLVLVCGSFFIMSDVKNHFGYNMEVD